MHCFDLSNFELLENKFLTSATNLKTTNKVFSIESKFKQKVGNVLNQISEISQIPVERLAIYNFLSVSEGDCIVLKYKVTQEHNESLLKEVGVKDDSFFIVVDQLNVVPI